MEQNIHFHSFYFNPTAVNKKASHSCFGMEIKRFCEKKLVDEFVVPFANIGILSMTIETINQLEITEIFLKI